MSIAKYIAQQFGKPTGIGGKVATLVMNLLNRKMYRLCGDLVKEYAPNKILDVGFGNGYALAYLSKRITTMQLYGIDISKDALAMAKRKLGDKASLSVGSIENLAFDSDYFDLIYTINTFYFWQDQQTALSEVKRVMGDRGVFVNICYTKEYLNKLHYTNYGFTKMDSSEILELHRNAGFSAVKLVEIESEKSFYIICVK